VDSGRTVTYLVNQCGERVVEHCEYKCRESSRIHQQSSPTDVLSTASQGSNDSASAEEVGGKSKAYAVHSTAPSLAHQLLIHEKEAKGGWECQTG